MFKKLLALALLVIGGITLSACNPDDGLTTEEILTQIQEAVDELDLPSSTTSDLTLPNTGVHDVEITWSSNNTDVIANDGTVTIPTKTDGDQTVTLTATLTLEGQTLTDTFSVTVAAASDYTDAELLEQAKNALVLSVSGIIQSNDPITLPATGLHGSTITWASSNTAVITDAGVVTRPAADAGNATVTLTATLTLNAETTTKAIEVIVADEDPAASFDSIALLIAGSTLGDIVEYEGTVSGLFDGGYFLSDGTNALGVYNPSSTLDIEVGDTVYVKGSYAKYNTLFQIGDVQTETITAEGTGVQPLTATAKTVAEINALDSSDPLIHGQLYTIQGVVTLQGSYNNIYIVDGTDEVLIYYYSLEDSLAALEEFVGKKIEITVIYYTDHGTNGVMLAFQGLEADIALAPLTDAEAVVADADAAGALDTVAIYDDVTLPTTGVNGTTYGTWTSDTPTLVDNTGALVGTVTEATEVVFTTTVTKGTESEDATLTLVVVPMSPISDVLELEADDYFLTEGVVYEEAYYGVFIHDGGVPLFIYSRDLQDDVEPGDTVKFLGKVGFYSGLLQANIVNDDVTITAGTDAAPTPVVSTVEAAQTDMYPRGTIYTVTAFVTVEGSYNDVYLNGLDGGKVKVYYRSNADEIAGKDDDGYFGFYDQWVTLDIVTYQDGTVLFQGLAADVTATTEPAGYAPYAQAVLDNIVVDGLDYVNFAALELPTRGSTLTNVMITWSTVVDSGDGDIASDGTVTFGYGAETELTLTATVVLDGVTYTRDFDVVIADGDDLGPKDVAFALDADLGDIVVIQGVISGLNEDNMPFIQDADGTAIFVYDWDFRNDVEVGDEVIVRAERAEYNGLQQLKDAVLVELVSEDNTPFVITDVTPTTLGTAAQYPMYQGSLMTMELTFQDLDDGFGYMLFDGNDLDLKIAINDCELCAAIFEVGDKATFTFIAYEISFGSVELINPVLELAETTLTDAQNQAASEFLLDIPTVLAADLTLPTTVESYGATITWATSDAAVITAAGVVTRPSQGSADATATLTATIQVGSETAVTKDFVVTVIAEFAAVGTEIFISEYIEGSSNNKALELFNPTADIIDLDGYEIIRYNNGSTSASGTLDLSGYTILPGQTLVIYNPDADQAIKDVGDISSTITYYNGDDAVGLYKDGTLIDLIGIIGVDPGTNWTVGTGATSEYTLTRDPSVTGPVATWDTTQWVVSPQNTFDDLGEHTVTPTT
jgi:predicted extracellular nuclease